MLIETCIHILSMSTNPAELRLHYWSKPDKNHNQRLEMGTNPLVSLSLKYNWPYIETRIPRLEMNTKPAERGLRNGNNPIRRGNIRLESDTNTVGSLASQFKRVIKKRVLTGWKWPQPRWSLNTEFKLDIFQSSFTVWKCGEANEWPAKSHMCQEKRSR